MLLVNEIDWDRLQHNYGPATDVPDLLRGARDHDPEVSGKAVGALDNHLYHQGGWVCSAATAALPFLIALAADPLVRHRPSVLRVVASLVETAATAEPKAVDPGWPAAWRATWRSVLPLVADRDAAVRGAAAHVLGLGAEPVADAVAALVRQWADETDAATRLDLVMAVGDCVCREEEPAAVAWLRSLLGHDDPQVRLAAVRALHRVDPEVPRRHLDDVLAATRDGDLAPWLAGRTSGRRGRAVVRAVAGLFRDDPLTGAAFALGLCDGTGDAERRAAALVVTADLLSWWRSPAAAFPDVLADRLGDPEPELRYRAAHLLGCLGPVAARTADRLAGVLDDDAAADWRTTRTVGAAAAWALARMGDHRCLPVVLDQLAGGRALTGTETDDRGGWSVPTLPAVDEVLGPLPPPALLPAVRARLVDAERTAEQRALVRALAAWGPSAAPAVPELVDLLDTAVWQAAAKALGAIGPDARDAADHLAALLDREDAGVAAWALWRVTGDPAHAPALLGDDPDDLRMLADLGPQAVIRQDRLAELAAAAHLRTAVEAAHAHWRVGGDPEFAARHLVRVIQPLAEGEVRPGFAAAVRYLGAIGPLAAPAAVPLRAAAASDRRLAHSAGRRAFTEDEELRAAIAWALPRLAA